MHSAEFFELVSWTKELVKKCFAKYKTDEDEAPTYYNLSTYATSNWTKKTNLHAYKKGKVVTIHLEGNITVSTGTVTSLLSSLPTELKPIAQQDLNMMNFSNAVCRAWITGSSVGTYCTSALTGIEVNINGCYMTA